MSENKHLLVITPFDPCPTDSGGKTRLLFTLKHLSQNFKIKLFYFTKNGLESDPNKAFFKRQNIVSNCFKLNRQPFLSFIRTKVPYWFHPWYSEKLTSQLKKERPKKVLVESTQLLYLVNFIPKKSKKIFTAYDISTISYWRRLNEVVFYKKPFHFLRLIETYLYERIYLPKYDTVIAVSQQDAKVLSKIFKLKSIIVVENGIEKVEFIKNRAKHLYLGYLGSPLHPPNITAVNFLCHRISPLLGSHKIVLAGSGDFNQKNRNIKYLGYVNNKKDFYTQIGFLVAPIFAGSGSRLKILEALSYGIPVVTTKIGAEGISLKSPLLKIISPKYQTSAKFWVKTIHKMKSRSFSQAQYQRLKQQLEPLVWKRIFQKLVLYL